MFKWITAATLLLPITAYAENCGQLVVPPDKSAEKAYCGFWHSPGDTAGPGSPNLLQIGPFKSGVASVKSWLSSTEPAIATAEVTQDGVITISLPSGKVLVMTPKDGGSFSAVIHPNISSRRVWSEGTFSPAH